MQTARRLYVYLMTGIGLGVLVFGLRTLLTVLLEQAGVGASDGPVFGGEEASRQQLTLAFALISVSLPIWLIHWFLAERSVRADRPGAEVERNSVVRGLYFAVAMGLLLLVAALAASGLIVTIALAVTGGDVAFRSWPSDLATLVVAAAAWAYHVFIRNRDWKVGPIEGAAAFLPRAYLYVAAFAGLIALITGINRLIELLARLVIDAPPAFVGGGVGAWWGFPLADGLAGVVVGGAVWLGHSLFAERIRADTGWRGASERPARLRLAYFVAVILASVAAVAFFLAEGGRGILTAVLGVSDALQTVDQIGLVVVPALSAITFGVAWFLHQRRLHEEAATVDSTERMRTAERLALYAPSLVGLAFASGGVASLIGLLIDAGLGGGNALGGDDFWRRQLAQFLPAAVVGVVVWLWSWGAIGSRYADAPAAEAAATTRRVYLLLVLAGGVLAGIVSLGTILYRLFGSLFGIDAPADAISELSLPIGGLLVSAALAAYHGQLLRRDQGHREDVLIVEPAAGEPAAVVVRLVAPPGTDVEAALSAVREGLPAGYRLDVVPPPHP